MARTAKVAAAAATPEPTPAQPLVLLVATTPVRHNGRDYAPGEEMALPEDAAGDLLLCGAAETLDVEDAAGADDAARLALAELLTDPLKA